MNILILRYSEFGLVKCLIRLAEFVILYLMVRLIMCLTHVSAQGSTGKPSLVPRPHTLTRRNGLRLVNQVKFLGLAAAFATV